MTLWLPHRMASVRHLCLRQFMGLCSSLIDDALPLCLCLCSSLSHDSLSLCFSPSINDSLHCTGIFVSITLSAPALCCCGSAQASLMLHHICGLHSRMD